MASSGKCRGRDKRLWESEVDAEPSNVGKCSGRKPVDKLIQ